MPALKVSYHKSSVDIVYVENVADWITVVASNDHNIAINCFLNLLGLMPIKDNFKYRGKIAYEDVYALKEVLLYGNTDGKIWMLRIKTFTP
jgi:hypothetical protein